MIIHLLPNTLAHREQLNASKKRNPNKQISRSMRSLTDGDILYENEFVVLPPKTRRNRKRNVMVSDDLFTSIFHSLCLTWKLFKIAL